ncbi:MAG: UDP-2,3-diacylglucosamine diphosphatase LpxI [Candidatus Omnitrophica bacterium]|nr:UDP-2,3-diacylglucosamine diphosphatase LpxI [Candidatus Omnitrophota bacterium]
MEKIALISGNGNLPIICALAAKKTGAYIVVIAIKEEADKQLADIADKIYWISVGQFKTLIEILKKEEIKKAIMVGQIKHKLLFSQIELDLELTKLLFSLKDKKTDTILGAIAQRITQLGIEMLDSSTFIKDYLAPSGLLTARGPSKAQNEDIEFGLIIAKQIAGLDIGQTVVVKDKVVLSVEAIEGTDEAIRRANYYCQGNAVVVKVSKPNQDMRFDIPLIGLKTIKTLIEEKVAVLAIEAGKTLFLDKDLVLDLANKNNIIIIAK